jgi:hypothetical protein
LSSRALTADADHSAFVSAHDDSSNMRTTSSRSRRACRRPDRARKKGDDMHIARPLRALAVAGISAVTILAGTAAIAGPAASSPSALYTAPPVQGVSPAACEGVSGSAMCFLDSGNWAGYSATADPPSTSFINAQVSYSVPSVNCKATATGYVSTWAGIGGFSHGAGNGTGLEADGVTAHCAGGTPSYRAWWETYPKPQTDVFSVNPGDAISSDVSYDNSQGVHHGQYHLSLTDQTTGRRFSLWRSCAAPKCLNTSAEVISSAPSDAHNGLASSILPLADYGAANFEGARITNQRGQAGGFTSTAWPVFFQVSQQGLSSGRNLATPGPLYGGQAFANTWQHAS